MGNPFFRLFPEEVYLTGRAYRWIILFLAWFIYFVFGLIFSAFAPLVTPIMSQLNLTHTEVGAIAGAWQLIYIFAAYPAGIVVDRLGYKKSLLLGLLTISTSSLLRGFATDFKTLLTYTALFGLGGPMISIGLPKLIASWFTGDERGFAAGVYVSGTAVGSTMGLAFTNSLILPLAGSWERVFIGYSIIGFFTAILWSLLGRQPPRGDLVGKTPRLGEGMEDILRMKSVWLVVFIGISAFLVGHGIQNWLPKILEIKGYSAVEAGFIASLLSLSRIPGSVSIPRISYYIKSKKGALSLTLLSTALLLPTLDISRGGILILETILLGFFIGGLMPLLLLIFMDMPEVGSRYMGITGGIFFSIGEIGGFSGPFLIGLLKDITGSFTAGMILLSLYTGAMILPTLTIRETTPDSKANTVN